nr:hypothetical protein [Tanacetum cinerariifolium]
PEKYAGLAPKPPHFSFFPECTPHFRETSGTYDREAESSRFKCPRQHKTVEELLLPQVHHEFLQWEGCSREAKSRYNIKLAQLLPRHIYSPCVMNWDVLNQMGCDGETDDTLRIRLREAGLDEEIFTFVAWIRDFNINELIYAKLFQEFYSIYEFAKVCTDYELQSKKIIKFRLGGRAHKLTLLEFPRRLGLYQATPKWVCKCSLGDYEMDEEERSWDSERELNLLWYHGVFEHIDGVYSVPLKGAYNTPGYAQPQYNQ